MGLDADAGIECRSGAIYPMTDRESMTQKLPRMVLASGSALLVAIQFIRPAIPTPPATADLVAPPRVKQILETSCYDCHSYQTKLAWFDQIVPAYWLVRQDVLSARERLNFSNIGSSPVAAQKAALYEGVNMVKLGMMPLPPYVRLHQAANVTPEELKELEEYLAPWTSAPDQTGSESTASANGRPARVSLALVQPEPSGFPFDPNFESWAPISTTDRGDNSTFRFILGNDVAVKAAESGHILPWPDGTRFAKIAWQQELGSDGLIHPGQFVQVELMLKDAHRYKDTEGWGWGRWRGLDLKPYGATARFVNECTGCHQPMRGNDYVYTLPITAAKVGGAEVANNSAAALSASLPYQPLGWSAITMFVDPSAHTMATLYGDATALRSARAGQSDPSGGRGAPAYSAGSVLALVTWVQRDDPHWFGARIPAVPRSVEFVQVANPGETNRYRHFTSPDFTEDRPAADAAAQRTSLMLSLVPARLP
jgi:hypothetical protein